MKQRPSEFRHSVHLCIWIVIKVLHACDQKFYNRLPTPHHRFWKPSWRPRWGRSRGKLLLAAAAAVRCTTRMPITCLTKCLRGVTLPIGRRGDCIKTNQATKHTLGLARLEQYRQPNNQELAWWEQTKWPRLPRLEVSQETKHTLYYCFLASITKSVFP